MKIVLLDFDKTILNTIEFIKIQREFWRTDLSPETNAKLSEHIEAFEDGKYKVFRAYDHVTDHEWLLAQRHMKKCVPKLLYADALDFIERVDTNKVALAILTFGDHRFQGAKVIASGLNLPAICTENDSKANVIREWWNGETYIVGGKEYDELVLVDDRMHNFDGFESLPRASGYLIARQGREKAPDLPTNVSVIGNFDEIML
jgi:hypothetical protein